MKKLIGTLVAGAVVLVPSLAMADTVSSTSPGSASTSPIFVVGTSSSSGTTTGTSDSGSVSPGPASDKPAPHDDKGKHDDKGRHDDSRHDDKAKDAGTHGPAQLDQTATVLSGLQSLFDDPSLVRDGGWKFG